MPRTIFQAAANTMQGLRDEFVDDLRRLADEQLAEANATKANKAATALRNRAAALHERADFWAEVQVAD